MDHATLHDNVEHRFRALLAGAGLPEPDDIAHLRRALVFVWYDTKAVVLVDLDELPAGEDPFEGFDPLLLEDDILAGGLGAPGPFGKGFAETG